MVKYKISIKKILITFLAVFMLLINSNTNFVKADTEEHYATIYIIDTVSNKVSTRTVALSRDTLVGGNAGKTKTGAIWAYGGKTELPSNEGQMGLQLGSSVGDYSVTADTPNTDGVMAPSYVIYPGFTDTNSLLSISPSGMDRIRASAVSQSLVDDLNSYMTLIAQYNKIELTYENYPNFLTLVIKALHDNNDKVNLGANYGNKEIEIGSIVSGSSINKKDLPTVVNETGTKYVKYGDSYFLYSRPKWDKNSVETNGYVPIDYTADATVEGGNVISWYGITWYAIKALNNNINTQSGGFDIFYKPSDTVMNGTGFIASLVDNIQNSLGIPTGVSRIFNSGIYRHGGNYFYGLFRTEWFKGASLFYWASTVFSIIVLLVSAIKLLGKRSLAVISPSERVNLKDGIVNIIISIVFIGLFLPIFYFMCWLNYKIVETMATFISANGNYGILSSGIIAKIVYLFVYFRIWVEFLTRGITVLLCYVLAPVAISSIGLGRNNGFFMAWSKELIVNIFIQSMDAIVCGILYGVASAGSWHWLEALAFSYMIIPLNRWIKNNLFGMRGSGSDGVADETQRGMQKGLATAGALGLTFGGGALERMSDIKAENALIDKYNKENEGNEIEKISAGSAFSSAIAAGGMNVLDSYGPRGLRGSLGNISPSSEDFDKVHDHIMKNGTDEDKALLQRTYSTMANHANRHDQQQDLRHKADEVERDRRRAAEEAEEAERQRAAAEEAERIEAMGVGRVAENELKDLGINTPEPPTSDSQPTQQLYTDGKGNFSFHDYNTDLFTDDRTKAADGVHAIEVTNENKDLFNPEALTTVKQDDGTFKNYALYKEVNDGQGGKVLQGVTFDENGQSHNVSMLKTPETPVNVDQGNATATNANGGPVEQGQGAINETPAEVVPNRENVVNNGEVVIPNNNNTTTQGSNTTTQSSAITPRQFTYTPNPALTQNVDKPQKSNNTYTNEDMAKYTQSLGTEVANEYANDVKNQVVAHNSQIYEDLITQSLESNQNLNIDDVKMNDYDISEAGGVTYGQAMADQALDTRTIHSKDYNQIIESKEFENIKDDGKRKKKFNKKLNEQFDKEAFNAAKERIKTKNSKY